MSLTQKALAALQAAGYDSPAAFALKNPGAHCWFDRGDGEMTYCAICRAVDIWLESPPGCPGPPKGRQ